MAPQLPRDFAEFLSLLNKHEVNYLLIGGVGTAAQQVKLRP